MLILLIVTSSCHLVIVSLHDLVIIVARIRQFASLDTGIRVSDTQTREDVRVQP